MAGRIGNRSANSFPSFGQGSSGQLLNGSQLASKRTGKPIISFIAAIVFYRWIRCRLSFLQQIF
jgi:hypothetical protein